MDGDKKLPPTTVFAKLWLELQTSSVNHCSTVVKG